MTQLEFPIIECDPRIQLQAARRLQKLVDAKRKSFEVQDFANRRSAMLKVTRA